MPSGAYGSEAAALECSRCGHVGPPEEPGRCSSCKSWLPKNRGALVVGHRSAEFWSEHEAQRRSLQRAIVTDAGHAPEDAPKTLQIAADGLSQAVLIRDSAFHRIVDSGGPLTSKGRTRRAFTVWVAAVDRVERHVRLLGLRRVPKPVKTLEEVLAGE